MIEENPDDHAALKNITDYRMDDYERADLHRYIHDQIALLPVHYRTVLTLYHLDEFSYEEVGQITGMPEGTVKNYLFRAKALLKEKLKFLIDENSLKPINKVS